MRTFFRGLSQLALTVGAVLLLFVAYEVWVTDWTSGQQQEQLADQLRDEWTRPAVPARPVPEFGDAFAFLHIPAFGPGWAPRAVIEGTDPAMLSEGPGHYVGSAMPGEPGNFSMAGHRVGRGSPFLLLDELARGDAVVIETRDAWYVYRVTTTQIVDPSAMEVVAAVPPGHERGGSYLTMTTCNPRFSARERLVVHAELDVTLTRDQAPAGPAVLGEGS